jgi:hypothetical protein
MILCILDQIAYVKEEMILAVEHAMDPLHMPEIGVRGSVLGTVS